MTKGDLINTVAKVAKMSKRAAEGAVNVTFESLVKAIKRKNEFRYQALAPSP